MVKIYRYYGGLRWINNLIKDISSLAKGNDEDLSYEISSPKQYDNVHQLGTKLLTVQCSNNTRNIRLKEFLEESQLAFSPQEERNLASYTPLLHRIISSKHYKNKILKDVILIFREHSLISVYNLFEEFRMMGLAAENLVYYSKGDKCKNVKRIETTFKRKGYSVNVLSPFESISKTGKTEDEVILPAAKERVRAELRPFMEKAREQKKKVVLFDDGGLLITTAIDLFGTEYGDVIAGFIETTKGGMHAIESRKDLPFTIVNMANCEIKELMSSVISESIILRLREMLPHVGFKSRNIVVVGFGSLGKHIARILRFLGSNVYICEKDETKIYEATSEGFEVSENAKDLFLKKRPFLIMGCTGLDALTYENLSAIKRDTYIATVSSNEIKQSYKDFDKTCKRTLIENWARIYKKKDGTTLTILGNGASLNLFGGEGANHGDYQPFLALMAETIAYLSQYGPIFTHPGLDTELADKIAKENNILEKFINLNKNV